MTFADYLSQYAKLSPNLIQLVRHALALEPSSSSKTTRQGMLQLCQHVQALGRYGTTAFLVPLYGSGELSQSFCRSAAVHGATYLLRRAPKRVVVQENKVHGILLNRENEEGEKMISCDHVVVGAHAISSSTKKRLWRRISIVQGRLLQDQEQQRHVLIVPPGEFGNPCAIHGLVVDHTVHVAPPGCTMLHLTTTTDNDKDADKILEQVVTKLKAEEIHHVSFSYAIPDEEKGKTNVDGLHVCQTSGQSLTLDAQVEQAKTIFQSICPDLEFLTMSQEMDNIVKERLAGRNDEEDEERMVLQSAMNMMEVDAALEQTEENDRAIDDLEDSVADD
jgi:RAB protein geranylgeranyltransferase component A